MTALKLDKIAAFFVTCVIANTAGVPMAYGAGNTCSSVFGVSSQKASVLSLLKVSKTDLMYLNKQIVSDVKYPFGHPLEVLEKVLKKVNKLSRSEREVLAREIENSSPFTEKLVNDSIRFILGDASIWKHYLNSVVTERSTMFDFAPVKGFWAVLVKDMPLDARMKTLTLMGKFYDSARSSSDGHGSPKRELDYLAHSLLQGGELIKSSIESDMSPMQAYDSLLRLQQETLLSSSKKRGGYSSEAVAVVLRAIRDKIKEDGLGPVLLGGSFTAGRANLRSSDIDFMADDDRYFTPGMDKSFDNRIQSALSALGVESSLVFENFPGAIGKPRDRSYLDDLASSNAVLFYIDKNQIQMRVYETKPWHIKKTIESSMSTPTIYKID